jgi:hypothetical protein
MKKKRGGERHVSYHGKQRRVRLQLDASLLVAENGNRNLRDE